MQNKTLSMMYRLGLLGIASGSIWIAGCGVNVTDIARAPQPIAGVQIQGKVFGGQQPVSGSTLQLYVAGSAGYGSAAYALLPGGVVTDANGNFNITGDYTCPAAASEAYIVATGGNPGSGNNPQLALMAALGPCGNLTSATSIVINELTTVASVWSLAPFMASYANVGSSPTNTQGLAIAFATVPKLSTIGSGTVPGSMLPAGAMAPVAELNTLADIIASCVNSSGDTSTSTSCGALFSAATPASGTAPTDTIGAALDIATNPSHNVGPLIAMASPTAPFQPTVASATDLTISIHYGAVGFSTPSAEAIDTTGNIWVTNAGNNTIAEIATTGAPVTGSPYSGGGLSAPSGIAFDQSGNAWVTDKGSSKLSVFSPAGVGTLTLVVGLSTPTAIAINGQNMLWITNSGNSTVTSVTVSGTAPSSSTSYSAGGVNAPVAVAINPH